MVLNIHSIFLDIKYPLIKNNPSYVARIIFFAYIQNWINSDPENPENSFFVDDYIKKLNYCLKGCWLFIIIFITTGYY